MSIDFRNRILIGDSLKVLRRLPSEVVDMCVTSPPYYGLRDYGMNGQIGMEATPEEYIDRLVAVFSEVKRVLKNNGTLWVNIGDSYWSGKGKTRPTDGQHPVIKPKDLIGIPWMLAFALRADGWYLRQDIIWHKPAPMPEAVKDRCTKSHEYIYLLSKSNKYFYDYKAIAEKSIWADKDSRFKTGPTQSARSLNSEYQCSRQGVFRKDGLRNKRDVWTENTSSFKGAHFAVFPEKLIAPCIKAGSKENDIVLDPFLGSGTTAVVSRKLNRNFTGIELNPEYGELANNRLREELGLFL